MEVVAAAVVVATEVVMEATRTVRLREVHGVPAATATVAAGMHMVAVVLAVRGTAMGRAETAFLTCEEAPTMEAACLAPVGADGVVRIERMAEEAWATMIGGRTTAWPPSEGVSVLAGGGACGDKFLFVVHPLEHGLVSMFFLWPRVHAYRQ